MTKRRCAGVVSAWVVAVASLTAANVWESKPFNTWTDKELQKVLTGSPWAGKAGITYVKQSANQRPIVEEVLVTWASARVMREALAREEFGATSAISKEAEGVIAQKPPFYMVTVKISKAINSSGHASRASQMKNETFLVLRGKPPIPATQAEGEVLDTGTSAKPSESPAGSSGRGSGGPAFAASPAQRGGGGGGGGGSTSGGGQPSGGGRSTGAPTQGRGSVGGRGGVPSERPTTASLVIFRFPRDPITPDDKEVEFVTRLCGSGGGGFAAPPAGSASPSGGPPPGGAAFELAAGAQQRGGGGAPSGGGIQGGAAPDGGVRGAGNPVRMGDPLPTCNYQVKKKFKLKDMMVKGELQL